MISKCRKYRRWIGRRLDHDLDAADAVRLQEHLDICDDCRRAEAAYLDLSRRMAELDLPGRTEAVTPLRRPDGSDQRPRRRRWLMAVGGGLVAAAVVVAAIRWFWIKPDPLQVLAQRYPIVYEPMRDFIQITGPGKHCDSRQSSKVYWPLIDVMHTVDDQPEINRFLMQDAGLSRLISPQ